ncbi:MAG: hypothetical protein HY286_19740 [Planctomycetes bacterium]|nr:hypothetical protein [Planctomycetota bacterium]
MQVPGYVTDLSLDASGNLLFSTEQKDLGRITIPGGQVNILANATTGPFPNALRGVSITPSGDLATIDSNGDIYKLPGGTTPAIKVYSDLYLITDPTDFIVDSAGNYIVTSQTPSTGYKAIDWISPNGSTWAYYLVKHLPVSTAFDPVTNNLLIADATGTGALRMVDTADPSHPTSALDTTTNFGFSSSTNDGDMVVEADGNILIIANGKLYRYIRSGGTTSALVTGLGASHGIMIAASSGNMASTSGYSAYIATGVSGGPTSVLEYPNVSGPATIMPNSLGTVPGKGNQLSAVAGINIFEMVADDDFNLLVGGDVFGVNQAVKRINTTSLSVTTVANQTNGISSRVTGLTMAPDRSIYALNTTGSIQRIVESPLSVTTVFSDPSNVINLGEDFVLDRSGAMYVATTQSFGSGYITSILNGVATNLVPLLEARGLSADPFTAAIFYTEWVNVAFVGRVGVFNALNNTATPISGFSGMNYTNASGVWADGDTVVDCQGNIYTCSEDDFSVYRFNRTTGQLVRIASGYLYHPSGLAIAKSTPASGSTTGWSLYVSEYTYIYEIPSMPAPMSRIVDVNAPPVGRLVSQIPGTSGLARAMIADPAGNGFYICTSATTLEHYTLGGLRTVSADTTKGLSGDLTSLGANSLGHILVGNRNGTVWDIDPTTNFSSTVVFPNSGGQIFDLRALTVDGNDKLILFERPAGAVSPNAGKVYRYDSGTLTLLDITNRGYRGAVDPLTGDFFIPEMGSAIDGGGEILRVEGFSNTPYAGHYRGASFFTFKTGTLDGGLAFTSTGSMYLPISVDGRVYYIDRNAGTVSTVAGNYDKPVAVAIAPGTTGVAGSNGMSLFVLDRAAIFETGINGLPAGPPPASNPNLEGGADLKIQGMISLGGSNNLQINHPSSANQLYLVVASLSGKVPGFDFSLYLDPNDPRVLPNNPDDVWNYVNNPLYMPDFVGFLDGNGQSPATMQLLMPNDPNLINHQFLDFAWIALEPSAMSGIAFVGGTAQIYLGN